MENTKSKKLFFKNCSDFKFKPILNSVKTSKTKKLKHLRGINGPAHSERAARADRTRSRLLLRLGLPIGAPHRTRDRDGAATWRSRRRRRRRHDDFTSTAGYLLHRQPSLRYATLLLLLGSLLSGTPPPSTPSPVARVWFLGWGHRRSYVRAKPGRGPPSL
jgi:hypothetical protein